MPTRSNSTCKLYIIGIEDNPVEKMRFKRQLEEKVAVVETIVVEEPVSTPVPEHYDVAHDNGHKDNTSGHHDTSGGAPAGPQPKPSHTDTASIKPLTDHKTHSERVRQMLVNNYRPVQPLNGRMVYRSFPFFDEPITKDTEVVYVPVSEEQHGSGSAAVVSLVAMVCSILATIV